MSLPDVTGLLQQLDAPFQRRDDTWLVEVGGGWATFAWVPRDSTLAGFLVWKHLRGAAIEPHGVGPATISRGPFRPLRFSYTLYARCRLRSAFAKAFATPTRTSSWRACTSRGRSIATRRDSGS